MDDFVPSQSPCALRFSRRSANERGAALVEFSLVLPVLALLLFGMVEFGFGFNQLNSLRTGTREGARQAVVANFGGDDSCSLTGASASGDTKELICLVKDRVGMDQDETRVRIHFPTTNDSGESILVCTQYPISSITGFFSPLLDGKAIRTKVEMRIEQEDDDLVAVSETAISGGWGWCT